MNQSSPFRDNVDAAEVAKFNALAHRWWDPNGDFKALHDINPSRTAYIMERTELDAGPVVDIGCGGGILTEALAATGAEVWGVDMAGKALSVARLHALETNAQVNYQEGTAEEIAAARVTERGSRADDKASEAAMEDRKKQGYF